MSFKACVYNGCENYSIGNERFGNFRTFFRFPKDPERFTKWMELGKVAKTLNKNELTMCSDHFDKRYLAISPRRTTLVGLAVPMACEKKANDDTITSTFDFIDYEQAVDNLELHKNADENGIVSDFLINGATNDCCYETEIENYNANDDNVKQNFHDLKSEIIIENDYCIYFKHEEQNEIIERKEIIDVSNSMKTSKIIRKRKFKDQDDKEKEQHEQKDLIPVIINKVNYKEETHTDNEFLVSEKIDDLVPIEKSLNKVNVEKVDCITSIEDTNNGLIDNKCVITLLLGAREYVQMPKEYYLQEKRELLAKIEILETKMHAIQQSIEVIQTFIEE